MGLWIIGIALAALAVALHFLDRWWRSKMTPEQIKQEDEQAADDNWKW